MTLKPINRQTIVITGASSGIGLATARAAAEAGANVVLTARSGGALDDIVKEITDAGGKAVSAAADVADEAALRKVAQLAQETYGGFDTWVNNAGVSVYAPVEQVSMDDARRVFETNFWGLMIGCRIAAEHLKTRGGGSIVNLGSVVSDRALPIQGIYSATKHAVKALTEALRIELEAEGAGISVTLIKPGPIDTPYLAHAKNYMADEPTHPKPVYAPELVAETILHAAAHGGRELFVGGGGAAIAKAGNWIPGTVDLAMKSNLMEDGQSSDRPNDHADALHSPGGGYYGSATGPYSANGGAVRQTSLYAAAERHPYGTAGVAVAVGLVALGLIGAAGAKARD